LSSLAKIKKKKIFFIFNNLQKPLKKDLTFS